MQLIRFRHGSSEMCGFLHRGGIVPMSSYNARTGTSLPDNLLAVIQAGGVDGANDLPDSMETVPLTEVTPLLPYDVPPKIWCIGLNYKTHAEDIDAVQPEEPGSFMKPASCMFPPEGTITLPPPEVTNDVDAEG
ncbi:MAG TPA: fumarylacetoacetate hydrolase family protein, partial [Bryobacteraceae bacterium]|nr:fumarylacetoacetate hydrolase family protein [Bryobacteraceae bacterium]